VTGWRKRQVLKMDKPRLDQGPDYERGFIDGMMYQTETTVNRAVDAMAKRAWVGLTKNEIETLSYVAEGNTWIAVELAEAKLKEKNT
jgi:hypothetical protein